METKILKLSQVKVNGENPRSITTDKFTKLVNSILVFPKMLSIRPVVVDKKRVALGGNMRFLGLREIAKMTFEQLRNRLYTIADFLKKSEAEKQVLIEYWKNWLVNPTVEVVNADNLTEDEKQQFIIKDNVAFGTWDYNELANKWESGSLGDWGLDVWQMPETSLAPTGAQASAQPRYTPSAPDPSEEDPTAEFQGALPPELQGVDIVPNNLPKIEGSDETAMERVIIVFPKERKQELATLLGLPEVEKVVYRLEEIIPEVTE